MSRWETASRLQTNVTAETVWKTAYADAKAWPRWNAEIEHATLVEPLALGAKARIKFRSGLRLRFHVVEYEEGRLFTDEAHLPGARMGHCHLIESAGEGLITLTNTIYIEGPLAPLWRRILGPAAARTLPEAQAAVVEVARAALVGEEKATTGIEPVQLPSRSNAGLPLPPFWGQGWLPISRI